MQPLPRILRAIVASFAVLLLATLLPAPATAQAYAGRPKLIVIVVIDQFRGDYLNRDRAEFKGRGFRLFTEEGAWFTDCYYDYANTKTAPGHATIGTGAYTDGHGIETNEWWDASRSFEKKVTSVEDERYQLVDLPAASLSDPDNKAASPRNLRATTLGDELRLATQGRSRVFGISLKDRAAILPAGQAANGAFWIDHVSGQFTTSTYYMEHLPLWAHEFNKSGPTKAAGKAGVKIKKSFYDEVGITPTANSYELDFAQALITGEKLGRNGVTDLVVVSLSANDIQGHQNGPDSDSEERMIHSLDRDLNGFVSWLDQSIGLQNVWLALTADHGTAPVPREAAKLGIHSGVVNTRTVYASLNAKLNERYTPGKQVSYLMPGPDLPYIVLDRRAFEKAEVDEKAAEDIVASLLPQAVADQTPQPDAHLPAQHRLPPVPQVAAVYTRLELAHGQLPPSEWGHLLAHSYTEHGNWFVMLVLGAYQMEDFHGSTVTTHFTPWSYDRHVPLAFYGAPFRPGEYHGRVAPVDLAATLASLVGINQPSAAVGRVLTEAIKPIKQAVTQ